MKQVQAAGGMLVPVNIQHHRELIKQSTWAA